MTPRYAMSGADAAWRHMDRPTNLMVINGVLRFDEAVDWRRLREVFCERIVDRFDRFRQRAVGGVGASHWEDVEPELDLHFHHVALPAPGGRLALEALVSDRASSALDPTRPLWEVHFIDGFGAGSAVLVRVHHCVADGIALARVMLDLTDGGDPPADGFDGPADGAVGVEDPVARMIEVKRRMEAIKGGHEGIITYAILELMGRTPPPVEARLVDFFSAKGSMGLTNVPGPPRALSVAGVPLRGVLVWAPCAGSIGMSVSLFSYAGKVTVGFLTDAGLVPDPGTLADGFRAELLRLSRLTREPAGHAVGRT